MLPQFFPKEFLAAHWVLTYGDLLTEVASHPDSALCLSWSKPVFVVSLMSPLIPLGHHLILRPSPNTAQGKDKLFFTKD